MQRQLLDSFNLNGVKPILTISVDPKPKANVTDITKSDVTISCKINIDSIALQDMCSKPC